MPENAARTPSRVHALLGVFAWCQTLSLKEDSTANLKRFLYLAQSLEITKITQFTKVLIDHELTIIKKTKADG
jgi:hypothetical protein